MCLQLSLFVYRKRQLERDLTPYYAYDQSEAEVIDGLLYTADSSSVDMLCVVADHYVSALMLCQFVLDNVFYVQFILLEQ